MAVLTLVNTFSKVLLAKAAYDLSDAATVIKVGLCTGAPTVATSEYGSISGELTTQYGYTAGGYTLASKAFLNPGSAGTWSLDAADVTWTFTGSVTFRYVFVYIDHTVAGYTKPLIGFYDAGSTGTITISNAPWSIIWNANGIFSVG